MATTTSGTIDSSSSDFVPWSTAFVFALVSLAVYRWILSPILTSRRQPSRNNNTMGNTAAAAPAASTAAPTSRANHEAEQSEILTLLAQNATFPSHVAASTIASMATANAASSPSTPAVSSHQLLSNGLVAFRHTQAALYEPTSVLTSQVEVNRRDRARILSRMLSLEQPPAAPLPSASQPSQQQQRRNQQQTSSSPTTSRLTPPLRGGTLVVSVPEEDVDCVKLRRILYLLGTFYNLLLVVVVEPTAATNDEGAISTTNHALQNLNKLVDRVRGTDPTALPAEVLPSHRIITASSVVGRVALVRQLARVELVLECDAQVQVQLQRFGFKVLVYGHSPATPPLEDDAVDENKHPDTSQRKQPVGESLLGSLLLPGEL